MARITDVDVIEFDSAEFQAEVFVDQAKVPYARRVEYGFRGPDSLGRRFNQKAQPYLEPPARQNRGKYYSKIRRPIADALEKGAGGPTEEINLNTRPVRVQAASSGLFRNILMALGAGSILRGRMAGAGRSAAVVAPIRARAPRGLAPTTTSGGIFTRPRLATGVPKQIEAAVSRKVAKPVKPQVSRPLIGAKKPVSKKAA